MIEPQNYSYEEFPEDLEISPGMKELDTGREDSELILYANIPFINRDGLELHLQIISPKNSRAAGEERKLPCIVYVQGSAWKKQDIYMNIPNLSKLAAKGFVIASAEYRHSDIAAFPAQIIDVKTAICFIRKNASLYGVDAENIYVFGDSSGGHTALMTGITKDFGEFDTNAYGEYSAHVNGVIDFYGPTHIAKMNDAPSTMNHITPDSPEGLLIGGKNVIENYEEAEKTSPMTYISKERHIPPILMMHGSKDRLVPFNQSILLYEALKTAEKNVEFYKLKGADHGGAEFWTDKVIAILEEFIRKYKI
jgi:acetyl esterase/lipase